MKNMGKLLAKEKKYKELRQTDHYICTYHYQLKLLAIRRKEQAQRATAFDNESNREEQSIQSRRAIKFGMV